jgi:hypothetical protein
MGKFKKAFSKITKKIEQNVGNILPKSNDYKPEKLFMALATGGLSANAEMLTELSGSVGSSIAGNLSGPQQAVIEDTSVLANGDAEEMRKRKLLESQARNASGVRAQSVLNPV